MQNREVQNIALKCKHGVNVAHFLGEDPGL